MNKFKKNNSKHTYTIEYFRKNRHTIPSFEYWLKYSGNESEWYGCKFKKGDEVYCIDNERVENIDKDKKYIVEDIGGSHLICVNRNVLHESRFDFWSNHPSQRKPMSELQNKVFGSDTERIHDGKFYKESDSLIEHLSPATKLWHKVFDNKINLITNKVINFES